MFLSFSGRYPGYLQGIPCSTPRSHAPVASSLYTTSAIGLARFLLLFLALRVEQHDEEGPADCRRDQEEAVRGVEGAAGDRGRRVRRNDVRTGEQ